MFRRRLDAGACFPKHRDDVILAELKSETSANFRRIWAEALTRTDVCHRYLREILNWEGGNSTQSPNLAEGEGWSFTRPFFAWTKAPEPKPGLVLCERARVAHRQGVEDRCEKAGKLGEAY